MNAPSEPRVGHYLFAHRALPHTFLRDPINIIGILLSDDGTKFVSGMWDVMDEALEPDQRVDSRGLALEVHELEGGIAAVVITLPPPQRVLEAFFVAIVCRLEGDPLARIFSLDLAGPPGADPLVGILELDREGQRTLVEESCKANVTAFLDAVEAIVTSSSES